MRLHTIIFGLSLLSILIFSGCTKPSCGDNVCSGEIETNARCGSSDYCYSDCGSCYLKKNEEFVITRTDEQIKGLQISFPDDPYGATCYYEQSVIRGGKGTCNSTSVNKNDKGEFVIRCRCEWSEEYNG